MKKILYYIVLIIFLMLVIPITVLGGVGQGIKIPRIIKNISGIISTEEIIYTDKNGGPKIKVFVTKENKIKEMYLEEYVRGVISAEMPVSFDIEALKSQAIAARTFAVAKMSAFGGPGCPNHPGADICSEVHCQAWMSKEQRLKRWNASDAPKYWEKITQAVNETKGLILTYQGKLAEAVKYHSTSGGKTENSVYAFGYEKPYLVSVEGPKEEEAPKYKSTVVMKKSEFIKRMKELNSSIKISESNLSSQIKIVARTDGDRVKVINIGDKSFTGIDIRWAMNLNSANFTVKVDSKNVIFEVKGYGHGVGMSQWGANIMGKSGKKYDEILKHYYKGIEIKKIEEIFK